MKQEIIEMTYDLVDEIKNSATYKRLLELKKIVDESSEINALIERFQRENLQYEEIKKYGKYHPDLQRIQLSFGQAKIALYEHPVVAEYKQLEKSLQQQLDNISTSIATSISTKIKHPNEIGLLQKH